MGPWLLATARRVAVPGRKSVGAGVAALAAALVLAAGCEAPYRPLPYAPKAEVAPKILACHDAIGHIKGNKPWVLGGTCCCTPTRENYARHVADGTIDPSMTHEAYLALYAQKAIVTDLDHKGCNGLCAAGPHVLLGGKCMATPTPGTWQHERVTYGPHSKVTVVDVKSAEHPVTPVPVQN